MINLIGDMIGKACSAAAAPRRAHDGRRALRDRWIARKPTSCSTTTG
jgi:hypothetical protein